MSVRRTVKVVVEDAADLGDVVLSRAEGGTTQDRGLRDLVLEMHPSVQFSLTVEASPGLAALRAELESGESALISARPDIVILSLAAEAARLGTGGGNVEESIYLIERDLVAVIDAIKQKAGAHVLVANLSTIDPELAVYSYKGVEAEPFSLRAHRLDLMLVGVSHEEGISIIDVDRKIAEIGGENSVVAPARYNEAGCAVIAAEILRIIEEYGFFDDRPLLEQVGARPGRER